MVCPRPQFRESLRHPPRHDHLVGAGREHAAVTMRTGCAAGVRFVSMPRMVTLDDPLGRVAVRDQHHHLALASGWPSADLHIRQRAQDVGASRPIPLEISESAPVAARSRSPASRSRQRRLEARREREGADQDGDHHGDADRGGRVETTWRCTTLRRL
jgi:hypothetical protein